LSSDSEKENLALVRQKLKAGFVIWHFCDFTTPKPKWKLLLLVGKEDQEYLFFVINTKPSKFIQDSPELARCQVIIDLRFHTFLDLKHESRIDCLEPVRRNVSEIENSLVKKPARILGQLNRAHVRRVLAAVEASPRINGFDKPIVVDTLKPLLEKPA